MSNTHEVKVITVQAQNVMKGDTLLSATDAHDRDRSGSIVVSTKLATKYAQVETSSGTYPFLPEANVIVNRTVPTAEFKDAQEQAFLVERFQRAYAKDQQDVVDLRAKLIEKAYAGYRADGLADITLDLHVAEKTMEVWHSVILPQMRDLDTWDVRLVLAKCTGRLVEMIGWTMNHSTDDLRNALRTAEGRGLVKMLDHRFMF